MRLTAVYRILPRDDDFFEVCDECGFDGALVDMSTAAALMRSLGDRWASVFSHSEELLRARPAPETWCPVEYAQHTTFAIGAIEWRRASSRPAARLTGLENRRDSQDSSSTKCTTATGSSSQGPSKRWDLRPCQWPPSRRPSHLLDIRRGIARLQLAST